MIWLPSGGSKSPPSAATLARGEHYVRMEGRETYRFATRTMATTALAAIERAGLEARRHRPVHPPPGQRAHHRGGRQGPGPADGPDVRQPRPLRQHLGGVGPDRPGRGGRHRPGQGRRPDRASWPSAPASPGAPSRSSGRPTRPAAPLGEAIRPEVVHVRPPVDWDSVDPIPDALAEILARPGRVALDLRRCRPGRARAGVPPSEVPTR